MFSKIPPVVYKSVLDKILESGNVSVKAIESAVDLTRALLAVMRVTKESASQNVRRSVDVLESANREAW